MTPHPPGAAEAAADVAAPWPVRRLQTLLAEPVTSPRWTDNVCEAIDALRHHFGELTEPAPARQDAQATRAAAIPPEPAAIAGHIAFLRDRAQAEHDAGNDDLSAKLGAIAFTLTSLRACADEPDNNPVITELKPPASPVAPAPSGAAVPAYRAPGERMVTAEEADQLRAALTEARADARTAIDAGEQLIATIKHERDEARAEVASSHTAGFREGVEAAARKIEDADWGDFADLRSAIADSVRALAPPAPAAAREADLEPGLRAALDHSDEVARQYKPIDGFGILRKWLRDEYVRLSGSRAEGQSAESKFPTASGFPDP